jgi:biotin carboxyl carrier protein
MSPEYKAKLANVTYDVEVDLLDEGGVVVVKIGDQSFTMKPTKEEDGVWKVNDRTTDHSVEVLKRSGNNISIQLDGEEYTLEWLRAKKADTSVSTSPSSSVGPKNPGGVYPPMPGKITEVHVTVHDTVQKGDTLCILEAMKMFNELKAPKSGIVKEVNVETGTSVVPSDLLILIE